MGLSAPIPRPRGREFLRVGKLPRSPWCGGLEYTCPTLTEKMELQGLLAYIPYLYTRWKLERQPCACNRNCAILRLRKPSALLRLSSLPPSLPVFLRTKDERRQQKEDEKREKEKEKERKRLEKERERQEKEKEKERKKKEEAHLKNRQKGLKAYKVSASSSQSSFVFQGSDKHHYTCCLDPYTHHMHTPQHTRTHTHTHTHTHKPTRIYTHTNTQVHAYTHTYTHTHTHSPTHSIDIPQCVV